jgi:tetrahydromethanopterin S-methyltransferase subunit G
MKNHIKIFGLIIILAIAFSNASGQNGDFFASGEGGFAINLPENFTSAKDVEMVEQRMRLIGKQYIWEKENQFFYQIEFFKFLTGKKSLAAAQKKNALDSFRNRLTDVAKRHNYPFTEKPFSIGANPGRELHVVYGFSKVIYRFFIVNKVFYIMGTMIFNLRDEPQSRQILDSFKLLNKPEIITRKGQEAVPEAQTRRRRRKFKR